eukprot:1559731-Pyramimonas_sp.AAC.1
MQSDAEKPQACAGTRLGRSASAQESGGVGSGIGHTRCESAPKASFGDHLNVLFLPDPGLSSEMGTRIAHTVRCASRASSELLARTAFLGAKW